MLARSSRRKVHALLKHEQRNFQGAREANGMGLVIDPVRNGMGPQIAERRSGHQQKNIPGLTEIGLDTLRVVKLRSEEHTSELQSLMRISYAVFCLKKKKTKQKQQINTRATQKIHIVTDKHIKYRRRGVQ